MCYFYSADESAVFAYRDYPFNLSTIQDRSDRMKTVQTGLMIALTVTAMCVPAAETVLVCHRGVASPSSDPEYGAYVTQYLVGDDGTWTNAGAFIPRTDPDVTNVTCVTVYGGYLYALSQKLSKVYKFSVFGENLGLVTTLAYSAESIAFSPDGSLIVGGNNSATVSFFDAKTGQRVFAYTTESGASVRNVKFGGDGLLYIGMRTNVSAVVSLDISNVRSGSLTTNKVYSLPLSLYQTFGAFTLDESARKIYVPTQSGKHWGVIDMDTGISTTYTAGSVGSFTAATVGGDVYFGGWNSSYDYSIAKMKADGTVTGVVPKTDCLQIVGMCAIPKHAVSEYGVSIAGAASAEVTFDAPSLVKSGSGYYVAAATAGDTPETGVWKSTDSGSTWSKCSGTVSGLGNVSLFEDSGTLYLLGIEPAASRFALYASSDGGASWTAAGTRAFSAGTEMTVNADAPVARGGYYYKSVMTNGVDNTMFLKFSLSGGVLGTSEWTAANVSASNATTHIAGNWNTLLYTLYGGRRPAKCVARPDGSLVAIVPVLDQYRTAQYAVTRDGGVMPFYSLPEFGVMFDLTSGDALSLAGTVQVPGFSKDFALKYDAAGGQWWAVTVPARYNSSTTNKLPQAVNNTLAVYSSPDLREWHWRQDVKTGVAFNEGFLNPAIEFDGDDLTVVFGVSAFDGTAAPSSVYAAGHLVCRKVSGFRNVNSRGRIAKCLTVPVCTKNYNYIAKYHKESNGEWLSAGVWTNVSLNEASIVLQDKDGRAYLQSAPELSRIGIDGTVMWKVCDNDTTGGTILSPDGSTAYQLRGSGGDSSTYYYLYKVNLASKERILLNTLSATRRALAFDASGNLWVVQRATSPSTMYRIDLATGEKIGGSEITLTGTSNNAQGLALIPEENAFHISTFYELFKLDLTTQATAKIYANTVSSDMRWLLRYDGETLIARAHVGAVEAPSSAGSPKVIVGGLAGMIGLPSMVDVKEFRGGVIILR